MNTNTQSSKQQQLLSALNNLKNALPELRGALVATVDGLPISQTFNDNTDANRVAAMAATALGLAKRINDTVNTGEFTEMSVSGVDGQVLIYAVGKKGVLAVVTPINMNLGLLYIEARDAASTIASIL